MTRLREREHIFIRVRVVWNLRLCLKVWKHAWYAERGNRRATLQGRFIILPFLGVRCFGGSWNIELSYQEEEQSYVRWRVLQTSWTARFWDVAGKLILGADREVMASQR